MRKPFAATLLPLAAVLIFGGCASAHLTEADFIPQEMGVSDDGLWLYTDELTRMRSDGSDLEPLPLEREINGEVAELCDWLAETDAHTLFYVLTQSGEERVSALRVYDYETKRDEELIPAFSGEFDAPRGQPIRAGGGHVFAHARETQDADEYYLFDLKGNLLLKTQIAYEFDETSGLLHWIKQEQDLEGMKNRTTFRYYYAGREDEVVLMSDSYFWREYNAGGWSYLLFMDGSVVAVDLTTGEQKEGTLPPWDELHQYDGDYVFTAGGAVFVCTYRELVPQYGLERAELYALKGGEVRLLRAFGETGVTVYGSPSGGLTIGLTTTDLRESKLYLDDSLEFFDEEPAAESEEKKFFCGEYAFWVESKSWHEGFWTPARYCFYLWRQKGEEAPEIMQYRFSDDASERNCAFFMDILPV